MFWGGDEVLRWLKRYVTVERSGADPSVYLIEPTEEDKRAFGKDAPGSKSPMTNTDGGKPGDASSSQAKRDGGMDPGHKGTKGSEVELPRKVQSGDDVYTVNSTGRCGQPEDPTRKYGD